MTQEVRTATADIIFMQSKRVVLRPVLREDVPTMLRYINDPNVIQYLAAYLPTMEAHEEEWFANLSSKRGTDLVFGIVVEGKLIGVMGLHKIDHRNGTATTGSVIGEAEYWGKGYGTEAKMLLLNYAFNTLNLRKVRSSVTAFNKRSYNYSIKCGYKEEGRLIEQHYAFGTYWDEVLLAVFRTSWQPLWDAFAKEHDIATEPK